MTKHNDGGYREGGPVADAKKMAEMDGASADTIDPTSPMGQVPPEPFQPGPNDAPPEAGFEDNPKQTSMSGDRVTAGRPTNLADETP